MRRKSKLTIPTRRVKRKQPTVKCLKLLQTTWIKEEDEMFCYSRKLTPVTCRTKITLEKTAVFSPKSVMKSLSIKGTPRKQLKRYLHKSPKHVPYTYNADNTKTPSKSPRTKKVRKCLEVELFESEDYGNSRLTDLPALDTHIDRNENNSEICSLIPSVLENLAEIGCDDTFIEFLKLVNDGKFPLHNISFLLWMEVVKWFKTDNTCSMRYSDATKKFWKLGYRMFGGRFIHFMGGYKSTERVEDLAKGIYSPQTSDINFAVPDAKILRSFMPYDIPYVTDNSRKPGILLDMIESMSKAMEEKTCCVTFDGKKLKQGLTKAGGDIDIFGYAKGDSIADKRVSLEHLLKTVTDTKDILSNIDETVDIRKLSDLEKDDLKDTLLNGLKS